uniref:Uncharacterized protein n=1 Tax=viral metagenome TaxID=1070528 RepID=A0A6M3KGT8_9ZZZZ
MPTQNALEKPEAELQNRLLFYGYGLSIEDDGTICTYDVSYGWAKGAICGNKLPCKKHTGVLCSECGEPAVTGCGYAGFLVCGKPLCEKHKQFCKEHRGKS